MLDRCQSIYFGFSGGARTIPEKNRDQWMVPV
jgi:hypothetical protein